MFKNPPPLGHNKSSVSSQRSLKYRPDIDGLRAIAVLSVVLFHAFPDSIFRSGFAGVDIFFVISGFLISTIIFRGMNERMKGSGGGKPFSFIDFYSRRVRRIFPSLIFCLLTFLVLGHFVLLPDEYSLLWKHTAGASAYVSNLVLWSEAGDYFQTASQTKPLLHLWSLGIEEQFYLIWPLLLFIAYRLRFNILAITLIGALASFGFELSSVRSNPTAAFYSPFLRFWELMAGSLLAWLYKGEMFTGLANKAGPYLSAVLQRDSTKTDSIRLCGNILSVFGLVLILTAVFGLDNKDFPGYKALLPVMGAVLMIAAGKDAFINRYLLSNRVMVWFGLISYPLYIWHWPFISFAWIVEGALPELKVRLGCIALAVLMAAMTYYLVEPKLRWGRYGGYKAAGLLSVMIVIGVTGLHEMRNEGYDFAADDPEQPLIDAISSRLDGDNARCLKAVPDWNKLSDSRYFVKCRFEREPDENTIAIIGDSHGGHIYPGIVSQTKDNEGAAVFPAACAIPLMGLHSGASPADLRSLPTAAYSEHLLSEGFSYILTHKNVRKVILSHHPNCSWRNVVDTKNPGNHDFKSVIRDGFVRTYDALTKAGKEIYVIWDSPRYPDDQFLRCKSAAAGRTYGMRSSAASKVRETCSAKPSGLVGVEANDYWKEVSLETAAGYKNIHFIDLGEFFCPHGVCSMLDGRGRILYKDRHHLNIKGSIYAAPFIMEELRKQ
ncbi:MAG: acyltransferase family protein [Succinivibrionaceae bacterium]|nr:acyltransferase family protein [Succinivibrionaceae bacterium]